MTKDDLIELAEDFDKWLKNMEIKYDCHKDDIQELIKHFLM